MLDLVFVSNVLCKISRAPLKDINILNLLWFIVPIWPINNVCNIPNGHASKIKDF